VGQLAWLARCVSSRSWRRNGEAGCAAKGGRGFVVVDVETTGLDPDVDRVVEVALIRTDARGRVLSQWSTRVNPGGPIGAGAVHGITAADLVGAPRFSEVVPEVTARLAGRAVVAHHARFDVGFLAAEFTRAGWMLPALPVLCTYEASVHYLPGLGRRRLGDCCAAAGVPLTDAHSALGDARATAGLLQVYLDPRDGVPPRPEDRRLPRQATRVRGAQHPSRLRRLISGSAGTGERPPGVSRAAPSRNRAGDG